MQVKILGTGCPKCKFLQERVTKVAAENNIEIDVEKVTDINDIMSYGVMMTPGLVVGDDVKSSGKIPSDEQILEWLE